MFPMSRSSRLARVTLVSVACLAAGGCVFDSPYWAQTFASTTTAIPIQTWVIDKTQPVKIECSKAYHGGLYPWGGPEVWTFVTNITPSANASYDPYAGAIYSAGKSMTLPAACWNADGAYSPPLHMTALRASQGASAKFFVFDAPGLECLGREIGKGKSWASWGGCELKYSGSTTAIPYVRIIANTVGVMAGALPAKLASDDVLKARREAEPKAAELTQRLDSETADGAWAPAMEARLRSAFDSALPEGTQWLQTTCRATMCSAEVVHRDAAAQMRFVAALSPLGLFSNDGQRGFVAQNEDASGLRTTYFLAREGHRLAVAASAR